MGMTCTYRRLPAKQLAELEQDPEKGVAYLCSMPGIDMAAMTQMMSDPEAIAAHGPEILAAFARAQEDPTRVDLEKDWHALHFLLTGDASLQPDGDPDDPLFRVVMGGEATMLDASYGPARRFSRDEIAAISAALEPLTIEDLRERFSPEAFNEAGIYPEPYPGGWTLDEVEGLFDVFPKLQQLFADALATNEVVITYIN
ncbi:YfbM family protein [Blastopirellula sp. JC732]|uniref:YfbM family protein n=1 Tax=Blastopirellula sediminis TaxID=2894196 RepID=A0A9X1SG96_9BACT|nr:YfbM family protein [Blastopirellula sediminis]MCC9606738.1 YfbM family protein [Blastopirellula sediminis]MCC9629965.1 YfbM family protein [Blastopirellula sediminis]